MKNYFMLDGNKIPMSKETAESLREKRWRPFNELVDCGCIRVSSKANNLIESQEAGYPIRLSIAQETDGLKDGYSDYNRGDCPGDVLSIKQAHELIDCLTHAIKHHSK